MHQFKCYDRISNDECFKIFLIKDVLQAFSSVSDYFLFLFKTNLRPFQN